MTGAELRAARERSGLTIRQLAAAPLAARSRQGARYTAPTQVRRARPAGWFESPASTEESLTLVRMRGNGLQ